MFQLKTILNRYWTKIKYALWLILFFWMIVAIRTYVHYLSVTEQISIVNNKTKDIQEEMDYAQNFQQEYLKSKYWYLFLAHDNSMIFDGEEIVLFKSSEELAKTWFNTDLSHIPHRLTEEEQRKEMDPKDAWKLYLSEIWKKIN